MKRIVACVAFALLVACAAFSQSLGDVARHNRIAQKANKKKAAHVYTNDDIPSVAVAPPARTEDSADNDQTAPEPGQKAEAKPAERASEQPITANESYKASIEEARKNIDLLQRELKVAQREHQIQTAVYYADAGTRLRDPKDWTDKQKQYQDDIEQKTKALEEAKAKLEELKEKARKAGETVTSEEPTAMP